MDQFVERPGKAAFSSPEPIEAALGLDAAGKPARRRRRWPFLLALIVLVVAASAWWLAGRDQQPATS